MRQKLKHFLILQQQTERDPAHFNPRCLRPCPAPGKLCRSRQHSIPLFLASSCTPPILLPLFADMLRWLLNLFRTGAATAAPKPMAAVPDAATQLPPPFLRRETMLDNQQQVAAYAFSVATPAAMQDHTWQASTRKFFDGVLIDHFAGDQLANALGKRQAFLSLSAAGLDHPRLDSLPPENLVIEFDPPEGDVFDRASILQRLTHLSQRGFQLSCGFRLVQMGLPEALDLASYISLGNVAKLDPPDLLAQCRMLAVRYPETQLVAREIDSDELYQACRQMGMHLFQGSFLTRGGRRNANRVATYRMVVLDMLNAIRRQAEYVELAGIAWRDPALAYRLLRFVNSAAFGLREKIDRLKTALVYVGRDELYRWLTLLMFGSKQPSPLDYALRENALVRAKLAEKLADGRMSAKERDEAFVVGILSVIDALLEMPMQEALAQLSLPEAVSEALLYRQGKYAPYLQLAIACEESDQEAIQTLADACGMAAAMVNERHLDALIWAMNISAALEDGPVGA